MSRMKRVSVLSNPVIRHTVFGVVMGCLFPVLGMFVSVWLAHLPVTPTTLIEAQYTHPLLWIIDTAPLFIGVTFYLLGRREEWLKKAKDGLELAVEERSSELRLANQELQKDIEERKRLEILISRGKKEWESIFDAISDLIFLTDDQDKIVRCNFAAANSLNKARYTDLIGQPLSAILFPDRTVPEKVELCGKDVEFSCISGHYDVSVYPILVEGALPRSLYVLRNISARKQAEIEMLRQKQYFEVLVVNNPAAIVVLDIKGMIQSSNPAFEKLFNYSSEEVLGKQIDSLIALPEMIEEAKQYTKQANVGPVQGLGVRRRKDGSLVDVEFLAVPVKVGDEEIGILGIYHDITELLRARREAESANQAKSEFLANMSHEIRTPMNGVIGMIDLTLDTALTDEQRDYLQVASQSADTLLNLLNDILDYSKFEARKLEFETINFNLRTTIEDVAFTLAPRAQGKGLELACMIHPDLHSNLLGDPSRLSQILNNLVSNAIKFTQQGEIVIRAEPISEKENQAVIRFSVQDTGIGIPKERQDAIFDRFTQVDGSTTRFYGGTGLGLAICKQLVNAMGGQISIESTPGLGSTFSFILEFEKQLNPRTGKTQLLRLESVNIRGSRILVVDDNSTNRLVLTRMIASLDCHIDTASNGSKGLEMLRAAQRDGKPYRIVLLDMQMPDMDGEETARAMLDDPAGKQAKIIILTSMGQRGDTSRFEALGCAGYLLKPVKQHLLRDALIAVLTQRSGEAETVRLITRQTISEAKRRGLRILLAEDNPVNQKLTTIILQKAGFSVDAVENGLQAVEKVKTGLYDAVLMDVQMPELDGLEASKRIRSDPEITHHIPIIAMTAHAFQSDRDLCLEAGMDDYVSKPVNPETLLATLDRWTSNQEQNGPQVSAQKGIETQDYSTLAENFPRDVISLSRGEGLFGESPQTPEQNPVNKSVNPFIKEEPGLPMNVQLAMPRFDNDQAFFLEMCQEFMGNLPARMKELRSTLEKKDTANFSRAAHNLKGISANFDATEVNRIAVELEKMGLQEDLSSAGPLLDQLESENHRLYEFMLSIGVKLPQ